MTSKVSICNQALSLVGAETITSLDDDQKEAKLCKLNYDNIRDTVLEAHDWTFAIKWYELPKLADPPLSEYANAYEIPSEVLRVMFVGQDYNNQDDWQVEGGNIVTNSNSCRCQVIVSIDDPSRYSPLFVQAFVARLAMELAIPITNSRSLMESNAQLYRAKVQDAVTKDNQQGKTRRIRSRWLQASRSRGYRGAGPYV